MALLTIAVVVVGLLCLFDLVLSLGVIRRLRVHSEMLSRQQQGDSFPAIGVPVGSVVADFTATSTDGVVISRDGLGDRTLFAFFSASCPACSEQLPVFAQRLEDGGAGREDVVAVLVGDDAEVEDMRKRLVPLATVVIEPPQGPLAVAFGVLGVPVFISLGAGATVMAAGHSAVEAALPAVSATP